jgi:Zn-finger protein
MNFLTETFYFNKAWFSLNGYINSENNRVWSTENCHDLHEVPLHDLKVWVSYAIGA